MPVTSAAERSMVLMTVVSCEYVGVVAMRMAAKRVSFFMFVVCLKVVYVCCLLASLGSPKG